MSLSIDLLIRSNKVVASIFLLSSIIFAGLNLWLGSIIVLLTSIYLFIAGIHHGYNFLYPGRYRKMIKQKVNTLQWCEYMVTSSLMTILVGSLVGVEEISYFIIMIISLVAMNYTGLMLEARYQAVGFDKKLITIGSLLGVVPFILIIEQLIMDTGIHEVLLVLILLSLYICFPLNIYHYLTNDCEDFKTYQLAFMMISLVAKIVIAASVLLFVLL